MSPLSSFKVDILLRYEVKFKLKLSSLTESIFIIFKDHIYTKQWFLYVIDEAHVATSRENGRLSQNPEMSVV